MLGQDFSHHNFSFTCMLNKNVRDECQILLWIKYYTDNVMITWFFYGSFSNKKQIFFKEWPWIYMHDYYIIGIYLKKRVNILTQKHIKSWHVNEDKQLMCGKQCPYRSEAPQPCVNSHRPLPKWEHAYLSRPTIKTQNADQL